VGSTREAVATTKRTLVIDAPELGRRLSPIAQPLMRASSSQYGIKQKIAAAKLLRTLSNHYRPELHYMRGHGAKWLEKHGSRSGTRRETETLPLVLDDQNF
jgi:hypothetical protein